jgi:hypothetical protein
MEQVQAGEDGDQQPFGGQDDAVGLVLVVNPDHASQDALRVNPAVWPGDVVGFEQALAFPDGQEAVTGGTGHLIHNRQASACEAVEEGALADIGSAHQGNNGFSHIS